MSDSSLHFLADAAPILGAVLERDALLSGNAASERALVQSSERKLTRLGFDLHDGPIQDVAVLAEDLRLFGEQLELIDGPLRKPKLVRGRIEDLHAQLVSLDAELRRLSSEVQAASVLLNKPFDGAVRERIQTFAARTSIEPHLTLAGEMNLLSTSQQIALLNIIQEALSNIREHANATAVAITVSVDGHGVEAKVVDDGLGFELEGTLMRAAREGRVGLLAMHERVRLLGGQCRIESRPGGPTVVSVTLERWLPLDAEPRPSRVSA
jgi:signal transduction histidine kinase